MDRQSLPDGGRPKAEVAGKLLERQRRDFAAGGRTHLGIEFIEPLGGSRSVDAAADVLRQLVEEMAVGRRAPRSPDPPLGLALFGIEEHHIQVTVIVWLASSQFSQ